ncbi:DUF721 domain-containing protein [Flavobacterium alkalisoli]|uniref:DUF721 domain containing protein n=2 Tax=Flavobacterium TaxID=237 RepID=A0A444W7B9_9FLAO|nr:MULTISPECIES: DUF721 domain-containing protein [Flavobacterium]QEE51383.1 DUF721 domain-containing protein [Flavobacterium alkalisoli]RYJ41769.1 DUF721 domain containing protein [Flavobacterium beibuense]
MAKRLNDHSSLGDVLKEIIQKNNLQKGMDKIDVRDAWKNLMGNGVNNYTSEIMLKGTTLYVALTSAVLREELSFGKEKIVKMINEELGREVVKEVVLR